MTLIIQILTILILLGVLVLVWLGVLILLVKEETKKSINKLTIKKPSATIFDDEPKTKEEEAIEREERILKVIGSQK